jgi:hypothetical protein
MIVLGIIIVILLWSINENLKRANNTDQKNKRGPYNR